jgi:transcriptional regulator with XRE-family HTH domain
MESEKLGFFVAQRRKALGFSQNDLANAVNYTGQAISSFEKGSTSPSISVLPSLANFLELSLDDLLTMNLNPEPLKEKNPPFDGTILCQNLIALRKRNGYSQSQEGKLLGVSRRTIIHYENEFSIPSLEVLVTLLETYHISASAFFYKPIEGAPDKISINAGRKILPMFILGFALGGGLLSAILVPTLTLSSPKGSDSTSSTPYHIPTSSTDTSSTSSSTPSSSANSIEGLSKLVIITTNGASRSAGVTVGSNIALTLYAEKTFGFTSTTSTAFDLTWALEPVSGDISGIHLTATTPYPSELLSADSTQKAGAYFSVTCRLTYKKDTSRYFDAEPLDITVYGA